MGSIRANTVALNWLEQGGTASATSLRYARLLQRALRLEQHVVVFDAAPADWVRLGETKPHTRRIDVWWFEDDSSRLALLLAYLMTRTDEWDDAAIRVMVPAGADVGQKVAANLMYRLEERRIEATVEPVPDADVQAVIDQSRDASIVFLPFRVEGMRLLDPFGGPVEAALPELPLVTLVAAAKDVLLRTEEERETGSKS